MERQRKEDIEFEKKLDAFAEKAIVAVENITWKCFAGFGLGSAAGLVSQGIYSNHPAFPPSLVIRGSLFSIRSHALPPLLHVVDLPLTLTSPRLLFSLILLVLLPAFTPQERLSRRKSPPSKCS